MESEQVRGDWSGRWWLMESEEVKVIAMHDHALNRQRPRNLLEFVVGKWLPSRASTAVLEDRGRARARVENSRRILLLPQGGKEPIKQPVLLVRRIQLTSSARLARMDMLALLRMHLLLLEFDWITLTR